MDAVFLITVELFWIEHLTFALWQCAAAVFVVVVVVVVVVDH